ncbi:hypothetical protein MVI01_26930 [Myxococcus virescens]|uniref:Uncharacterized protein n=1 Tax=Myxococcus virescens TaxID=83456 RepID=A0A511HE29_9BACT|nr:hypothetical protein MVI01_26930 [Myxococcus virescens]
MQGLGGGVAREVWTDHRLPHRCQRVALSRLSRQPCQDAGKETFQGLGFTTSHQEAIIDLLTHKANHPVRRRGARRADRL